MERIGDLLLEHAPAVGPVKPYPLLLVHGMNGGAWYLRPWLYAAAQSGWDSWAVNLRGHHGSRPVTDLGRVWSRNTSRTWRIACASSGRRW